MSATSNVVTLLAEQNSETCKIGKCLDEQGESEKSLNFASSNCALDEAGRRKKRLEREDGLKSEINKWEEHEELIGDGATSLLTGEEIGAETFGIAEKRELPTTEPGLQEVEPSPGKIGRRKGKRDRKVCF